MSPIPRRGVRVLRNLQIDEISSVDRGAGQGCRIMLFKRDPSPAPAAPVRQRQQQHQPMEATVTLTTKERLALQKRCDETVIQRAARMSGRELVAFARTDGISKPELGQLIDDLAEAQRERGETTAQAYTQYITADPVGRELFQVFKNAPGPDHHQLEAARLTSESKIGKADNQASQSWESIVDGLMAFKKCTRSQAIDEALRTEEGAAAFQEAKRVDVEKNLRLQHGGARQ